MSKFSEWLGRELTKRKMSQTELAHAIEVTPAQVSRLVSGERSASNETLKKIAYVFKLPPEQVYRIAGELPPTKTKEDELVEELMALVETLPEEEQINVAEYIRLRHRIVEEREQKEEKRKPRIS